jgi:hypothetical protein
MKSFYIKHILSKLTDLLKFINEFFAFITLVFYSGYIIISNTNITIDGLPFDSTSYLNLIGLVFSSFILMMTIINVYKTLDYAMTNDLLLTHVFAFLLRIVKYILYLGLLTHTKTTLFLAKIIQNPSIIYELIFIVIIITITTAILNFINNKIDLYPKLINLDPETLKTKLKQKENIFKNQFSKTLKLIDFKINNEETSMYKKETIQLFIKHSAFVFLPELYISVETSDNIKEDIKKP